MHISKITLKNVRCFGPEGIVLDLGTSPSPASCVLILGDNGIGKTTILRSIALGLCDKSGVAALLAEMYGDWVHDGETNADEATILVEFSESGAGKPISIETRITRDGEVTQICHPDPFPWDNLFVCGYGAARSTFTAPPVTEYAVVDAVYTLFRYDTPLMNPEVILRRMVSLLAQLDNVDLLNRLSRVLELPDGSISLDAKKGLTLQGPWGRFTPLGGLGDGHQATLGWLCDLMGWTLLYNDSMLQDGVDAVVLVDEIEQHLHPSWQQGIIRLLHQQFPRSQFIMTSHSPLCAIGTGDLKDEECALFLLQKEGDHVAASRRLEPPRRLRADQVLTSYLFGLTTTRSDDVTRDILRYSQLRAMTKPSNLDRQELMDLTGRLDKVLGSPETELQHKVEDAVSKTLEEMAKTWLAEAKIPQEATSWEIKHQLRRLLDLEVAGDQD